MKFRHLLLIAIIFLVGCTPKQVEVKKGVHLPMAYTDVEWIEIGGPNEGPRLLTTEEKKNIVNYLNKATKISEREYPINPRALGGFYDVNLIIDLKGSESLQVTTGSRYYVSIYTEKLIYEFKQEDLAKYLYHLRHLDDLYNIMPIEKRE